MTKTSLNLTDTVYRYMQAVSLREPEVLKALREETAKVGRLAVMQIAPEQGQLMQLLVQLMGAKKIVEVGTFTGYSALAFALALPDDGQLIACDISDEWTRIGKPYWQQAGVAHKIDLRLAPAAETLQAMIDGGHRETVDMMFIDADKPNYGLYYELGMALVRPGGLFLFDNVLWSGDVADPTKNDEDTVSLRALNEKLHADERVTISMVPIADGLTLALKR